MRAARALLSVLLCLGVAGAACSGDADEAGGAPDGNAGPSTTAAEPVRGGLSDQYLQRYCEVLAVTLGETGTVAEVWGTQGLNDCPEEAFAGIDLAAVAAELEVDVALPNGPRYWVLDEIVANDLAGSGEVRAFDGLEMRSIALVDLGEDLPDPTPYTQRPVERDTDFVFAEGREVHELTDPDGAVYVMQSLSTEVAPDLDATQLAGLGERLALPAGWAFSTRTLDEELVVEDEDGVAVVVQDDLRNTYQLRTDG